MKYLLAHEGGKTFLAKVGKLRRISLLGGVVGKVRSLLDIADAGKALVAAAHRTPPISCWIDKSWVRVGGGWVPAPCEQSHNSVPALLLDGTCKTIPISADGATDKALPRPSIDNALPLVTFCGPYTCWKS